MKYYAFAVLLVCCSQSCSPRYNRLIEQYQRDTNSIVSNYYELNLWAAHPWKKDPSDSVPRPL
ncbi:MAG: hypothetical protein H7Y31_12605, partial [Chitinophagaceae bacterium]|nr:hypothetical protein [Chitinophagaceae bacterium]